MSVLGRSMIPRIPDEYLEKYLLGYVLLIPWGLAFQNIGMVLFGAYTLIYSLPYVSRLSKAKGLTVLVYCLPLITLLISLIYSTNASLGLHKLYGMLPWIVFPLFFFLLRPSTWLSKELLYKTTLYFGLSMLVLVLVNFMVLVFESNFALQEVLKLPGRYVSEATVYFHYLQFAYYLSFSITGLAYLWLFNKGPLHQMHPIIVTGVLAVKMAYLFLLGARISLAITVVVLIALALMSLYGRHNRNGVFLLGMLGVSVLGAFMAEIPLLEKIKEAINYKGAYSDLHQTWGGRMMRNEIWSCTSKLWFDSPILGHGIGASQTLIDDCLRETSRRPELYLGSFRFNAHSQYFQLALYGGIISLSAFLFQFYFLARLALKKKDIIFFCFLFISLISFTTESMLERNQGVVFFSFFAALFGAVHFQERQKEIKGSSKNSRNFESEIQ